MTFSFGKVKIVPSQTEVALLCSGIGCAAYGLYSKRHLATAAGVALTAGVAWRLYEKARELKDPELMNGVFRTGGALSATRSAADAQALRATLPAPASEPSPIVEEPDYPDPDDDEGDPDDDEIYPDPDVPSREPATLAPEYVPPPARPRAPHSLAHRRRAPPAASAQRERGYPRMAPPVDEGDSDGS